MKKKHVVWCFVGSMRLISGKRNQAGTNNLTQQGITNCCMYDIVLEKRQTNSRQIKNLKSITLAKAKRPLASARAVWTLCRTAEGKVLPQAICSSNLPPLRQEWWNAMKHQTEIIWSGATPRTPSSQAGGSNYIKFQRLDEPAPVLPFNILQPPSLSTPPVMPCHVLQPGSSCFTLTRRICQLMASDKSSEAPVHTFRRCKHTCAREPLAKHLHRALQPSQQSGITQKPAASVQTYPNCPYICCLNVVFPSHSKHWKWNNCISRWQFTSNLTIHQVKITLW